MILFYKNSVLASIVSVLGCIVLAVMFADASYYEAYEIALMVIVGGGLLVGGKLISMEKSFKTWWKQVKEMGLEEQLKTDVQLAQTIYSKNPKKRTLKEIAKFNPAAAEMITAQTVKK